MLQNRVIGVPVLEDNHILDEDVAQIEEKQSDMEKQWIFNGDVSVYKWENLLQNFLWGIEAITDNVVVAWPFESSKSVYDFLGKIVQVDQVRPVVASKILVSICG